MRTAWCLKPSSTHIENVRQGTSSPGGDVDEQPEFFRQNSLPAGNRLRVSGSDWTSRTAPTRPTCLCCAVLTHFRSGRQCGICERRRSGQRAGGRCKPKRPDAGRSPQLLIRSPRFRVDHFHGRLFFAPSQRIASYGKPRAHTCAASTVHTTHQCPGCRCTRLQLAFSPVNSTVCATAAATMHGRRSGYAIDQLAGGVGCRGARGRGRT